MANSQRVTNIQIGNGTSALPTAGASVTPTTITNGVLGVINSNMVAMAAGQTISDTEQISFVQGTPDATNYMKFSFPVIGTNITSYKGEAYTPATRDVWAVGYNRATASGSIPFTANQIYTLLVTMKGQKDLYAERPYQAEVTYTTLSTDTAYNVANNLAIAINTLNGGGSLDCTAIAVGNGTGLYGLTGATAWGIELTAVLITNQFFNSQYKELRPYFTPSINDGFLLGTAATVTNISHMSYGNGTYNSVYTWELWDFGYEGVTNRRLWPIPTLNSSAQDLATATTITPTAAVTALTDAVVASASITGMLVAGDFITIAGIACEIKYIIDSTHFILCAPFTGTTQTTGAIVKKQWYATIVIDGYGSLNSSDALNIQSSAKQTIMLCIPQGVASSAYNVRSTQLLAIESILNPWMASLPRAFANVNI